MNHCYEVIKEEFQEAIKATIKGASVVELRRAVARLSVCRKLSALCPEFGVGELAELDLAGRATAAALAERDGFSPVAILLATDKLAIIERRRMAKEIERRVYGEMNRDMVAAMRATTKAIKTMLPPSPVEADKIKDRKEILRLIGVADAIRMRAMDSESLFGRVSVTALDESHARIAKVAGVRLKECLFNLDGRAVESPSPEDARIMRDGTDKAQTFMFEEQAKHAEPWRRARGRCSMPSPSEGEGEDYCRLLPQLGIWVDVPRSVVVHDLGEEGAMVVDAGFQVMNEDYGAWRRADFKPKEWPLNLHR